MIIFLDKLDEYFKQENITRISDKIDYLFENSLDIDQIIYPITEIYSSKDRRYLSFPFSLHQTLATSLACSKLL